MRDAPAGVVLVRVGAAEIEVLAVEEEAAVGGPFEPADAETRFSRIAGELGADGVEMRVIRMPQLRPIDGGDWSNVKCRMRQDGVSRLHGRDDAAGRIEICDFKLQIRSLS